MRKFLQQKVMEFIKKSVKFITLHRTSYMKNFWVYEILEEICGEIHEKKSGEISEKLFFGRISRRIFEKFLPKLSEFLKYNARRVSKRFFFSFICWSLMKFSEECLAKSCEIILKICLSNSHWEIVGMFVEISVAISDGIHKKPSNSSLFIERIAWGICEWKIF